MKKLLAGVVLVALNVAPVLADTFSGDARAVAAQQAEIDQSQWVLQPLKDEARSVCRGFIALNAERWQMQNMGAGTNGAAAHQPVLFQTFMELSQRETTALQRCSNLQYRAVQCVIAHQQAVTNKQNVANVMRIAENQQPGSCVVPTDTTSPEQR